jgi:hypothetical protein
MTSPVWPDWETLRSYDDRLWAIVQEHLAGREEFEPAALRMAAIIRDQMHDPRCSRPTPPTGDASGGRPMWMITRPVPVVGDADKPRVSRLFERSMELVFRALEEGAA